jgi:hypothetical protein
VSSQERRQVYLRNAAEAQEMAQRANSPTLRKHYLLLARFWFARANEVRIEG